MYGTTALLRHQSVAELYDNNEKVRYAIPRSPQSLKWQKYDSEILFHHREKNVNTPQYAQLGRRINKSEIGFSISSSSKTFPRFPPEHWVEWQEF